MLRAAGALLCLFVAIPLVVGYALNLEMHGQLYVTIAVLSSSGACVLHVRPGWGAWLWGSSAVGNLLIGVAFGCIGLMELRLLSDPLHSVIGWVGVAFFMAGLIAQHRRSSGSHAPNGVAP